MSGLLTLIPTPLSDDVMLDNISVGILLDALEDSSKNIILVEDHKPARRRWISWGLPREAIIDFQLYNEHTMKDKAQEVLKMLLQGKNIFLMSDGGLPAFCDPGAKLIRLCHENKVKVTSAPFHNSIALAVALSGIDCGEFHFYGFPPKKSESRDTFFKDIQSSQTPSIIMDTPYRLLKTLEEISVAKITRPVFLALDLNSKKQNLIFGNISKVKKQVSSLAIEKAEFIIIIE